MQLFKRSLALVSGLLVTTLGAAVPVASAVSDAHPDQFDATSPSLTLRPTEFVVGASIDAAASPGEYCTGEWNGNIPMRLRWKASDKGSGIKQVEVWTAYAGSEPQKVATFEGASTTSYAYSDSSYDGSCGGGATLPTGSWLRAQDVRGNTATTVMVGASVQVWDENAVAQAFVGGWGNLSVTRTGTWMVADCDCFNHGHTSYTTAPRASTTYTVSTATVGQTIALVMDKGPGQGVVKISVDGRKAGKVNTHAATATHRVIVWQKLLTGGTHTIKLVNVGKHGRPRIDIDSVLLSAGEAGPAPVVGG